MRAGRLYTGKVVEKRDNASKCSAASTYFKMATQWVMSQQHCVHNGFSVYGRSERRKQSRLFSEVGHTLPRVRRSRSVLSPRPAI